MNLSRNFFGLNFAGDKNIGQLTLDLLKAIADELASLGKMPIFWVVFTIFVFTLLVSVMKARNAKGISKKIEEAFYDSTSIIISLFYELIGVFSVVLNFIRTMTEMLFGDLSNNLLKRLFAFAIIALSVTSFSTTLEGMVELFGWASPLVSFGVQILVLGLTYKIVLLIHENINENKDTAKSKSNDSNKALYNQHIRIPLTITSLYTVLPVLLILLYIYWNIIFFRVSIPISIIIYLATTLPIGNWIKSLFSRGKSVEKVNKTINMSSPKSFIFYLLLALAVFISSFFSYTSISNRFVNDQIDTDYLIATSMRAVEDLEEMECAMQEATNAMVARMNTLLNNLSMSYIYPSDLYFEGDITPSVLKKIIDKERDNVISELDYEISSEITKLKNDISTLDENIDNAENDRLLQDDEILQIQNDNTIESLENEKDDAQLEVDKLEKPYDTSIDKLTEQKARLNDIGNTTKDQLVSDFIDYKSNFAEELYENNATEYEDYIQINYDIKTIQHYLQEIKNSKEQNSTFNAALANIEAYVAKHNSLNPHSYISENEVSLLNANLLGIAKYFVRKNNLESSPKDDVREIASCYFAGELKDDSGMKLTAKKSSLQILGVLYEQVINYPKLDSLQGIMDFTAFKSPSFVETEQSVYVQIRTLNGEMKLFEVFLRKLFDRDAFPEMSIFALFLALIIDTAVVLLFILRGKDGPYGNTKLNSKRIIYLHTVETEKTPRNAAGIVSGTLANFIGLAIGIGGYIVHLVISQKDITAIYLVIYLFAGLIISTALNSLLNSFASKNKKSEKLDAKTQNKIDDTIYDEFTLKYDKTINDNTDEFYSCEILKNKIRTGFYFSKLHKRYMERLRERFFDTFVLFLCEVKTIHKDDRENLNKYISNHADTNNEKDKLKLESYVAWTDFDTAEKYDVLLLLRSLLSYDSKIMIITNDKIYIHNNFFKYVNELLWSRNSQYSNYGLNYSDYDIDEEGI